MKKQTQNIITGLIIFFILFFTVGGHFINKYYNEYIRSHPQMYCYQNYFGATNPVLVINNLKHKDKYIEYYNELSKGINPYIEFRFITFPTNDPVYVIEYTADSLLAKVVSYYNRGPKFGGSFNKGWVYAATLHENPPADE